MNERNESNAEGMLRLLASIDKRLAEQNELLRRHLGPVAADDSELDGQYGNPNVKYEPDRYYKGSFRGAGKTFSECPVDYLEALAKSFDASASSKRRKGEEKNADYAEKDAARARGWAKRLRDGWVAPAPTATAKKGNPWATSPAEDDDESM